MSIPRAQCAGCAPHIWGPGKWALFQECAIVADHVPQGAKGDPHSDALFRALCTMCCVLVACEPCRNFYAHAWSVLPPPLPSQCLRWIHCLQACVHFKITGAEGRPLSAGDASPSFPEIRRRLLSRNGTGVDASVLAHAFVLMSAQIGCKSPCPQRRTDETLAWFVALAISSRLLRKSKSPGASRFADAAGKALTVAAHAGLGADEVASTRTVSAMILELVSRADDAESPSAVEAHTNWHRAVAHARGSLPEWVEQNASDLGL